ncbi:MAG: hypothetical protein RJA98_3544 [Pseudomonadota bacterium]|jgi:AraC family transcriptional regulator of adaptative response / DNA-3-methyladenine glycosylase II
MHAMPIDADLAYTQLLARDAAVDGHWFVGVSSTRIYCRPICRVRTPLRRNCHFFETAARAEAAGFRPCLKCRPEVAPRADQARWSVADAAQTLAQQAAAWFDAQLLSGNAPSVATAAAHLGISERHLRRIFATHHGVTPLHHVQTQRLLLAKQLLSDSSLPITQVAQASGFGSVRRFNAAFAAHYRMPPSALRQRARAPGPDVELRLALGWRPPYDVAGVLRFLAQRAIPGVDQIDSAQAMVRRTLRADLLGAGSPAAWVEVQWPTGAHRVTLRAPASLAPWSAALGAAVRHWLDLDAQPDAVQTTLHALNPTPGLRLPGGVDGFELAVRAVLGQQVTVAAARTLAGRVVARAGVPLATPWPDLSHAFPSPLQLLALDADALTALGILRGRAAALRALAEAWPQLQPLCIPGAPPQPLITALCALPGIGPWTAHYIAMRALGWADAWLPGDVALRKAYAAHTGRPLTPREADTPPPAWAPWRAYAVLALWRSLDTRNPP